VKQTSFNAHQNSIRFKANLASNNFHGTVSVDKTMVGLGNVDNTSDAKFLQQLKQL
jgi:hypothetical protein